MSQIYILDDVNIYLISIVYKTWPDPLHHFSGQPCLTSSLNFIRLLILFVLHSTRLRHADYGRLQEMLKFNRIFFTGYDQNYSFHLYTNTG